MFNTFFYSFILLLNGIVLEKTTKINIDIPLYIDLFIIVGAIGTLLFFYFQDERVLSKKREVQLKEEEKQKIIKDIEKENKKFKDSIKSIYTDIFKNSEYKDIFNEKVFIMIDIVNDLNKEKLKNILQSRVQELINSSLNLYLINLESAVKMKKAQDIDINFDQEIKDLLNKNNEIIESLKEVITQLILINNSNQEFNDLIDEFKRSISNIQGIKAIREAKK
jgi:hypothetical protein